MMDFKDHFSGVSEAYHDYRPGYPAALFEWIAGVVPQNKSALDCGCGTGQASILLAKHFERVYAIDPSQQQIESADTRENIMYGVAPAEQTGLPDESQDLVFVAQALHWFDLDAFYEEVRRVARKEALFTAVTYGLPSVDSEVDPVLAKLYNEILYGYWPLERVSVDDGYSNLTFPFEEVDVPQFEMREIWDLEHYIGYLSTWSGVKEYRMQKGSDPLEQISDRFEKSWGDPEEKRKVTWPLTAKAGKIS